MAQPDNDADDYQKLQEVLASLPEYQRNIVQKELDKRHKGHVRAAISQVMARNNSHNLGSKLVEKFKQN
jgi:hypothetical protein